MIIQQVTDPKLAHFAYLLGCQQTGKAIVIDPQRDIERYVALATEARLTIVAALDTHIHADYLSGLRQFAEMPGVTVYASDEGGDEWRYEWLVGSKYSHQLLKGGDHIVVGNVRLDVRHTPGHTPEHLAYLVTDLSRNSSEPLGLISGDFVFTGDVGRPDLLERAARQQGTLVKSANDLFDSLQQFKHLSPSLLLWPGHGAGSACGKSLGAVPISTVGYELANNSSIKAAGTPAGFLDFIVKGQPEPPAYFARMKMENRKGPKVLRTLPEPQPVPSDQIELLAKSHSHVIVDTRPWNQFRAGHLAGALFAPLDRSFTGAVGSYISPDEQICLIVEPGRLKEAVTDCIRIGLDQVTAYMTPDQIDDYVSSGKPVAQVASIHMAELPNRVNRPDVLLLDVRREAELIETGQIAGAFNIAHLQLTLRHTELPRDKNIHVFCRGAERSQQAYSCLERLGYTSTYVEGGINAWQELKYSLVPSAAVE